MTVYDWEQEPPESKVCCHPTSYLALHPRTRQPLYCSRCRTNLAPEICLHPTYFDTRRFDGSLLHRNCSICGVKLVPGP